MSEKEVIEKNPEKPNTISTLVSDLKRLGIKPGMTLLVHSSMSSLGWVCGGAPAVILALEEVLTPEGTLVMPEHTTCLSDPAEWENPPVPASWFEPIRAEMPAFDRDLTPSCAMGVIAETFRKQRSVIRSGHPQESFAAWGKNKEYIIQDFHYDYALNRQSPLGRLYELDGYVLLLGVDYDNNTSLHLAEYEASYPSKKIVKYGAPVVQDGKRRWQEFDDIDFVTDDFQDLGRDFEKSVTIARNKVGAADCRLMNQRTLVDFAKTWMEAHRT